MIGKVHLLPGTTFSDIRNKGDSKPESTAAMTLDEVERWLGHAIVGLYHLKIGIVPTVSKRIFGKLSLLVSSEKVCPPNSGFGAGPSLTSKMSSALHTKAALDRATANSPRCSFAAMPVFHCTYAFSKEKLVPRAREGGSAVLPDRPSPRSATQAENGTVHKVAIRGVHTGCTFRMLG